MFAQVHRDARMNALVETQCKMRTFVKVHISPMLYTEALKHHRQLSEKMVCGYVCTN